MNHYDAARYRMVKDQLVARGISDERVLDAMRKVPRHLFVEEALREQAYGDHALPIGEDQTISQPYMVACMTEALGLRGDEKVLEIGTGSGYQTAVLAELASRVVTIERIVGFIPKVWKILEELNYRHVVIHLSDGTYGWKDESPFDAIMVTAGAPDIPSSLTDQLKVGGRLVIPVGNRMDQVLKKVEKASDGLAITTLTPCVFVPLIGALGWKEEGEERMI